ncbi:MAG: ribonuclease [Nocardioidaceae bacterium]|nr:ribonuclease [Nocardioidaceae bacterium]
MSADDVDDPPEGSSPSKRQDVPDTAPPTDPSAPPPTDPSAPPPADVSAPPPADVTPAPVAAPLLALRDGLPPVVTTKAQLDEAVEALRTGTGPLAVDAERASGYRYSQRAYLVQLRRAGVGSLLIDPLAFGDVPNDSLTPLATAVDTEEWIIHAASQDLPCLAELGLRPTRLFDTELAGRLLNYPRVGLAILVEDLLGYSMLKEHSAVDWSRRPLPDSWLLYAALDVELLIELRDVLADQLEAAGKAEWARQEFEWWTRMESSAPRREPWRRTSGIHQVRGRRGLAIVREMWQLRDQIAQSRDIAPGRILRDPAIVEAARAAPTSRGGLGRLPGFSNRLGQRYVRDFAAALSRALELPEGDLPSVAAHQDGPPPARIWSSKFPAAARRLAAARELVNALAAELDLPQENLLEPDAVRRLTWAPPEEITRETVAEALRAAGARDWQVGLTAGPLADTLASLT